MPPPAAAPSPADSSNNASVTRQRPFIRRFDSGKVSLVPSVLSASYVDGYADDEHTPSESSLALVQHHMEQPGYPGEDVRPTSGKELAGWYIYGWASEVCIPPDADSRLSLPPR